MSRKWRSEFTHAAAIGGGMAGIALIHFFTPDELIDVHYVLQRLFYVPVIYSGIRFGWKGGLTAGLLSGAAYLPQIVAISRIHPRFSLNQYVEVVLFCLAGAVAGLIATRERKQKEELRQNAETLSRVYAELQENFERMKRAERLYALGQMAAGLAHEIRNPLASVEGAASILAREPESSARRVEFLEIIQKECRRLNRLLTNFLNFAKPPQPAYRSIALEPLLDSVIALAQNAANRTPVSFHKHVPPNLPSVTVDPEQLSQVLLNLTINAVQAMPSGGEVAFTARRAENRMLVAISDQGTGVSETDLEKIFDPFFTTKESGTGLGLAVAHQIVLNQGGSLTASRNREKGMTFTVDLPLTRGSL